MEIRLTKTENMGTLIRQYARNDKGEEVSVPHIALPPTKDGIFSALHHKFTEPPPPEHKPHFEEPEGLEEGPGEFEITEHKPPAPEQLARVKATEDVYKNLKAGEKVMTFEEVEIDEPSVRDGKVVVD